MKKPPTILDFWILTQALIALAFTIGLVLIIPPWLPHFPAVDLDSAYAWATNAALEHKLVFGRDFIYNYGPLGSALTQMYSSRTDRLMICTDLLLALAFSIGALTLFWKRQSVRLVLLYLFVLLTPGLETIFQASALIYITVAIHLSQQGHDDSSKHSNSLHYLALALLTAIMASMPLIKGSFLTTVCIVTPASLLIVATRTRKGAALLALEFVFVCATLWILTGQPLAALPKSLASQLPIIASYTDAMSWPGLNRDIIYYLLSLFVTGWFGHRDSVKSPIGAGKLWTLCLLAVSFAVFKLAFVRHDGHALHAAGYLPLLALIATFRSSRTITTFVMVVAIVSSIVIGHAHGEYPNVRWFVDQLRMRNAAAASGLELRIYRPNVLDVAYDAATKVVRQSETLPAATGTADIYGTQQGLLLAYGFPWSPRPIIQSYQVTSPSLAAANDKHLLSKNGPTTVYFRLSPIDGRLPAIEDGLSWKTLLSRYQIESYTGHFLVMKKNASVGSAPSTQLVQEKVVPLGVQVGIPSTRGVTWAEIDLKPSLLGRIVSALYKLPELKIVEVMPGGAHASYRYVASMGAAGFVASPLVRTTPEFAMLKSPARNIYFANLRPLSFGISGTSGTRWLWARTMTVLRISAMVISRFGERDRSGRWCCAVNGL